MKLDVIYTCAKCGAVSVDSATIGAEVVRFDRTPICECPDPDITSSMELHTRDEGLPPRPVA